MKRLIFMFLTCACLFLVFSAQQCDKYTGGGWMYSALGPDYKATFGFQMDGTKCGEDPETGELFECGRLQYVDHGTKVAFHAVVDLQPQSQEYPTQLATYLGKYTPQPKNLGEGGSIMIGVFDSGAVGPSKSDYIKIELTGGVYNGYINQGFPQGGQITLREEE